MRARFVGAAVVVVAVVAMVSVATPVSAAVSTNRAAAAAPPSFPQCVVPYPQNVVDPTTDTQTPRSTTDVVQSQVDYVGSVSFHCAAAFINNGLDCRVGLSTLPSDRQEELTALGQIGNFLKQYGPGPLGDWFGDRLIQSPLGTTLKQLIAQVVVHCKVHPLLAAVERWEADAFQFTVRTSAGNTYSGQCQADPPHTGIEQIDVGTFFPPMDGDQDIAFGCAWDLGDQTVVNEIVHEGTNVCLGSMYLHSTANGARAAVINTPEVEDCATSGTPAYTAPGGCCALPGWGTDDPPPPWDNSSTGCELLTITSEDRSDQFYVEGDSLSFTLSAIDPTRKPAAQGVRVGLTQGDPAQNQYANLQWPGNVNFNMAVKHKQNVTPTTPRRLDYLTFYLFCDDGTTAVRYYDVTGHGGGLSTSPDAGGDLSDCLDELPDADIDPSSWFPVIWGGLKCLAEWVVVPPHPFDYYLTQWQTSAKDTGVADVASIASAPWDAIGAMADHASTQATVTLGGHGTWLQGRTYTFPEIPSDVKPKIQFFITLLMLFFVVRVLTRLVGGALGHDLDASPGGGGGSDGELPHGGHHNEDGFWVPPRDWDGS